jgi:electron transfer flavoprotein beta subunit
MDTANRPRPYAAKRIMKFKKARSVVELSNEIKDEAELARTVEQLRGRGLLIDTWNLDDISADLEWCGMSGSPTKVHRIQSVVLTGGEYHEFPATQEGCDELIGSLIQDHTIG